MDYGLGLEILALTTSLVMHSIECPGTLSSALPLRGRPRPIVCIASLTTLTQRNKPRPTFQTSSAW